MHEIVTERPNLFEPNDLIVFYAELGGAIPADNFTDAIKAAYAANEATMSKIVLETNGAAYYKKMSHSGCKVAILRGDWREAVRTNEKIPFDLKNGELIRCFLNSSEEKTDLLVMAHHLAGDGKAIVRFIEDVMETLSGASLTYRPMTPLTRESIPKIGKYPPAARIYPRLCNRKWRKMGSPSFSWEDHDRLYRRYWENASSYLDDKRLSEEETALVIQAAKRIGVSVNSYIITAFLRAEGNFRNVGIPVSVRENENSSMTNLTSGIRILYRYHESRSFSKNAKIIHRKVLTELKTHRWLPLRFLSEFSPALIDGVLLYTYQCIDNPTIARLAKVMGYTEERKRDVGITNLTVLDLPSDYGNTKIRKIIFIPPNVSYCNHVIGVSTFDGEMTLTYHGTEAEKEKQRIFFERGIRILLSEAAKIPSR